MMNFQRDDGATMCDGITTVRYSHREKKYILYWLDVVDKWEYSRFKRESKPEGWYGQTSRIPWIKLWTLRFCSLRPKSHNERIHRIIDAYLYKPPNGLMYLKGLRELSHLGVLY
jgi:hypothetical protein